MEDASSFDVVRDLFDEGLIRTWYRHQSSGWILRSGMWSPFYIQLRPLASRPALLRKIGDAMGSLIGREIPRADRLVGIAMAGIPIAVAASLSTGIPAAFTRKPTGGSATSYGEHAQVEGELLDGDSAILIDDVVTRFESKLEAMRQLENESRARRIGIECRNVCVVVNRLQGETGFLEDLGVTIHSLVDLTADGIRSLEPYLEPVEFDVIGRYLADPNEFQDSDLQQRLGQRVKVTAG